MIRARTLIGYRRWLQGVSVRALLAGADGLFSLALVLGAGAVNAHPLSLSDSGTSAAGRSREALRAEALRTLVEAMLGRPIRKRESSVTLALEFAGSFHRQSGPRPIAPVESMREFALRRLVDAVSSRPLGPNESPIARALELAKAARLMTAGDDRESPRISEGGS